MNKENIFKTTGGGRLYFNTSDFLKQPKTQQMVRELMDSELFKSIEKRKMARKRQLEANES